MDLFRLCVVQALRAFSRPAARRVAATALGLFAAGCATDTAVFGRVEQTDAAPALAGSDGVASADDTLSEGARPDRADALATEPTTADSSADAAGADQSPEAGPAPADMDLPDTVTDAGSSSDAAEEVTAIADAAADAVFAADSNIDTGATTLPAAVTGCEPVYAPADASPTCPLFLATWTCPGKAQFETLLALPDGGLIAAGSLGGSAWLVRTDGLGQVLWQKVHANLGEVTGLAATLDGGFVLTGQGPGKTGCAAIGCSVKSLGWLLRTDANGTTVWLKTWTPDLPAPGYGPWKPSVPPVFGLPTFVVALADGGFAVAGYRYDGTCGPYSDCGHHRAWLVRTDGQGIALWDKDYPFNCAYDCTVTYFGSEAASLVALADGGFALGLLAYAPMQQHAEGLVRLDSTGAVVWVEPRASGHGVALPDGSLLVAGGYYMNAAVQHLAANGSLLWHQGLVVAAANYGMLYLASLAALPGGDIAVPFSGFLDGKAALVRLTPDGIVRWKLPLEGLYTWALVGLADGGVAMAGTTKGAPPSVAFLKRIDRWGHGTCAESGPCAAMPLSACDDGDPCTSDGCSAKSGCTHTVLEDTTTCGWQETTKPGENAPLWCSGGLCAKP